jgi:hypothetical protein
MAVFDDARDRLPESDRALIDACLTTWSADPEWRYVADNLRSECALGAQVDRPPRPPRRRCVENALAEGLQAL